MSGPDNTEIDRTRFWKFAGTGASFQAGTAAIDSATVVASLVYHLTGSALAVGTASAVLRLGWLLPQLVVGYLAGRAERRMPFYIFGAYGRAICAGLIAGLLWMGQGLTAGALAAAFLVLWTAYAFVSGVVAVPYNDIVSRSIPSVARSRMLAWRFFGGGMFALGVAAFIRQTLDTLPVLQAYALIFALASLLLILSSSLFVSAGEPRLARSAFPDTRLDSVGGFLQGGWQTLRDDGRFRLFLYSQWLGGATLMALPFYVVAARQGGIGLSDVGILLGALMNGVTIAYLGYLMEISPDDRRPAYSAYFNALASPAALLPLLGAALVEAVSIEWVFAVAILAAICHLAVLFRLDRTERERPQ